MPTRLAALLLAGALLTLAGCTSLANPKLTARAPVDVPEHFVVGVPGTAEPAALHRGDACRNPMVDPRDGTRLRLVRSTAGEGDYAAPEGRYGLRGKELLRLRCSTGEVVGIVNR